MKKSKNKFFERGQSLVLVTVMLLGMIAMLALVLDGGNVYTQRRQAQAAADAGALAAARAHCDPDVDASPEDEAETYVNNNYANLKSITVDDGQNEVTVETDIIFDTFFLGILGRPEIAVEAVAAAKCIAGGGASVLPVAWSCKPPTIEGYDTSSEDLCKIDLEPGKKDCIYPDPPTAPVNTDYDDFYIIIDSDDLDDTLYCAEDYYKETDQEFSSCLDVVGDSDHEYWTSIYPKCDLDCDGEKDVEILTESSFGWLDLDGGGSDANELKGWINGTLTSTVTYHHWYAGKSGVAASVFDTVGDGLDSGDLEEVIVPIFDHYCHGVPGEVNFDCEWHPRDEPYTDYEDTVVLSGGTYDDYFHIIGFANYEITCVNQGPHGPCIVANEILDLPPNVKTIEGCFLEGIDQDITGYGGADFNAYTLVLSR